MNPGPAISTRSITSDSGQQGDQALGEVARTPTQGLGQDQGEIGREVAVGLVLGPVDLGLTGRLRQAGEVEGVGLDEPLERGAQEV